MSTSLIGLRVLVSMSDPWEFVTDNGESRTGTIVSEGTKSVKSLPTICIHFDEKIKASGVTTNTVFARFRHTTSTKQELLSGLLVPCNFSSEMNGESLSASSGTIAFIGGLRLLS